MLEGLEQASARASPEVRAELAELQLRALELLRRNSTQPDRSEQRRLDKIEAQALADAGRTDEALAAYRRLAAAHPDDGNIQEAYAQLLLGRPDRESLETALRKWREVQQKSEPASQRWFRAKYSVAWLHYRLGNKPQAARIITLMKLLHPELGGAEMKARFDELLRQCQL
jgi:predicted Zn-dependent protease